MDYANSRNLDEPSIDAEHIQDIRGAGKKGGGGPQGKNQSDNAVTFSV